MWCFSLMWCLDLRTFSIYWPKEQLYQDLHLAFVKYSYQRKTKTKYKSKKERIKKLKNLCIPEMTELINVSKQEKLDHKF